MALRKSYVEKIKNVAIVVLVLNTILLLYFYWNNDALDAGLPISALYGAKAASLEVRDVLRPERITLNFGGENYTVLGAGSDIWEGTGAVEGKGFMAGVAAMTSEDTMALSPISKEDYEGVVKGRSVQADFAFSVPFTEYCGEYGLKQLQRLDAIESFTSMVYSEANPDSFFICDKNTGKYYRLAVQNGAEGFKSLISSVESRSNASYYPLKTYSGADNEALIPLDMKNILPETDYRRYGADGWGGGIDTATDMAKAYFGDSFDFTRKMTAADGSVIYMYRHGEKTLSVRNGVFEYKAAGGISGGGGFFQALRTALDFLAQHDATLSDVAGGFRQARGGIYLKKAERLAGANAYRFHFGLTCNGWRVFYDGSEPFVVEASEQRVSYSRFDLTLCLAGTGRPGKDAVAPFDILVENHGDIFNDLARSGQLGEERGLGDLDPFVTVMERVADVGAGYLRPAGAGVAGELAPVWMFDVAGVEYYFGLYSGAPAS